MSCYSYGKSSLDNPYYSLHQPGIHAKTELLSLRYLCQIFIRELRYGKRSTLHHLPNII
jgi:hypothetical protein